MKKLLFAALGVVSLVLPALPALASFSAPYKYTNAGKTYVYFPGLTAGQIINVRYNAPAVPKVLTLDACGWVLLKNPATTPIVDFNAGGATRDDSQSGADPVCTNGVSSSALPVGSVIEQPSAVNQPSPGYWIRGGTSAGGITASVIYEKGAKVTANDCGFGRLGVTATRTLEDFYVVNGAGGSLAGLPATTKPQICKAAFTGGPKVQYVPAAGF